MRYFPAGKHLLPGLMSSHARPDSGYSPSSQKRSTMASINRSATSMLAAFGVHRRLLSDGEFQGGGECSGGSRSGYRKAALSGLQQSGLLSAEDGGNHGQLFRSVRDYSVSPRTRSW